METKFEIKQFNGFGGDGAYTIWRFNKGLWNQLDQFPYSLIGKRFGDDPETALKKAEMRLKELQPQ